MLDQSIVSGSVYVFFQTEDYPNNISFIQWDPILQLWSHPTTLFALELIDDAYPSNPRVCYYNGQIYIFGRVAGDQISFIQYDGTNVTDPTPIEGMTTIASATPCVMDDQLYIVFSNGSARVNPVSVCQLSTTGSVQELWTSVFYTSCTDIAVVPTPGRIGCWGNNFGTLVNFEFFLSSNNFLQTQFDPPPLHLKYPPFGLDPWSPGCFICGSDENLTAVRVGPFGVNGPILNTTAFDGIHPSSSPSAISLGGPNYLVFYGDVDNRRTLMAAKININLSSNTAVQGVLDFGVSLGPANCSPYAILIP